jgi:esterase/lipase superfamily enzyme
VTGLEEGAGMSNTHIAAKTTAAHGSGPKSVLVNFATNRARLPDDRIFGADFDQQHIYVVGTIEVDRVSLKPDPNSLKVEGPPKAKDNSPLTLSDATKKQDQGSLVAKFASELAQHQKGASPSADNGGLLFIHGYNNSFLDSMAAAADLVLKYDLSHVFCFSWPSFGDWLNYKGDQSHAQQSAPAVGLWFANMLAQLSDKDPLLHLICHSMGNRVLSGALQTIKVAAPHVLNKRYFEHAIIAAADVSWDAFVQETQLKKLPPLSQWVHIYTNGNDLVLALSGAINHNARLGAFGPDQTFPQMPPQTIWIDCSAVGGLGEPGNLFAGHRYYRLSPPVIADLQAVLSGKKPTQISGRRADPNPTIHGRKFYMDLSNLVA